MPELRNAAQLPKPITKEEYIGQMKMYFPHLKRWRKELTLTDSMPENPALAGVKELIADNGITEFLIAGADATT